MTLPAHNSIKRMHRTLLNLRVIPLNFVHLRQLNTVWLPSSESMVLVHFARLLGSLVNARNFILIKTAWDTRPNPNGIAAKFVKPPHGWKVVRNGKSALRETARGFHPFHCSPVKVPPLPVPLYNSTHLFDLLLPAYISMYCRIRFRSNAPGFAAYLMYKGSIKLLTQKLVG